MSGFTLDAGALIAAERGDERVVALLQQTVRRRLPLAIPAGVLAQVWRADARQHRLAMLLSDDAVELVALDRDEALRVGSLCRRSGTSDVVDASVAVCARARGQAVVTSDPTDLGRLDADLALVVV